MKYSETRIVQVPAYTHRLNSQLLEVFTHFVREHKKRNTPIVVGSEKDFPGLTYSERCNFQKLQYWDLVYLSHDGFVLTKKGDDFYRGRISIVDMVATLDGTTLSESHPAWETHKTRPKQVFIWQMYGVLEREWKEKHEYQEEASPQTSIYNFL